MIPVSQIRKKIESILAKSITNSAHNVLAIGISADSFGHEAGDKIEKWLKEELKNNGFRVYFPDEFLTIIFKSIGRDKEKLLDLKNKVWWGKWLMTESKLKQFITEGNLSRWQQEGGDVILFYGDDLTSEKEKIILLNAKSHNKLRNSRDPNIISGNRLLKFFSEMLQNTDWGKTLNNMNLWFIGVDYVIKDKVGIVKSCSIKDLFLLDIAKIPQINFDAAIQLQWHVPDMIEVAQKRTTFISNLATTFMGKWGEHVKKKTNKYTKMVEIIKKVSDV